MIWRMLHVAVALNWAMLAGALLLEVAEHGDLPRTATDGGHWPASTAMWFTALFAGSAISAIRALWLERA